MARDLLTGNVAAAWGARLADVDYVPAYPITPQTEIIESLAHWIGRGELAARMVTMDSEHSMLTAAGGLESGWMINRPLLSTVGLATMLGKLEATVYGAWPPEI